jgi:FtsP/CotA-like multicopper oxidase with cupredoxin domain
VRPGRTIVRALIALTAVGLALVLLVVAVVAFLVVRVTRLDRSNVGQVELTHPLRIPPLLEGRDDGTGTKVFDLRMAAARTELLPGRLTDTWGLNGPYLGPTLRASRGDRVRIDLTNGTAEDTTVHWHGMHLPAAMDGGPHQSVAPGATWSPRWTIDQPAATLWYHPHPHGHTADQVQRGAAGMFLLDDGTAGALDLPDRYGVDDVPVIIQDRSFAADGSFTGTPFPFNSRQVGDQILVNGTWGPVFEATTTRVRLRLLNASGTRVYRLGFTDGRRFAVIGTDSGLLPAPVDLDRVELAPGERAEVVVDVRAGDDTVLRSVPGDLGNGFVEQRADGGDDTMDVLRLRGAASLDPSPPVPAALVPATPAVAPAGAPVRTFGFSGTTINGRPFAMGRVDTVATLDRDEVWAVSATDGLHVFHLHDVRFRVLDIDGAPPPPVLAGWKDTIRLVPGRRFRLLVRFEDYADPAGAYMFHCHVLEHEDQGMMGQVVVVPPGVAAPDTLPHGG